MFFRQIALCALLLSSGCVGRTIREDTACEIVPPGTAEAVRRSFHPSLDEFIDSLNFSTFDATGSGYSGYYCPGVGVCIAKHHVGRVEFETSVAHEVLHAVHFHDLFDEDAFHDALQRLLADPEYSDFVDEVEADGWQGFIYFLFEESEYFARVGDEIVRRRGINVPEYLWPAYRGILHPAIEENGRRYRRNPFPEKAGVQFEDGVVQQPLLKYAIGLPSAHDHVLPRRGARGFIVDLDIDAGTANNALMLRFLRSTGELISSCHATLSVSACGVMRWRCTWDPGQARDILTAWLDHNLVIEGFDPMSVAMTKR